jgi:hypothetical protein
MGYMEKSILRLWYGSLTLKIGLVPELAVKLRSRSRTNLSDSLVPGGRSQAETWQQYRKI